MADSNMTSEDDSAEQTVVGRSIIAPAPVVEFRHFLIFTLEGASQRVAIGPGGVVIGRVPPADVAIASPEVSRRHCRVEIQGDFAIVSDLGSTNGIRLDGVRLERPTRLLSGAQFTLGSFALRYERRDSREVDEETELSADLKRAEDYVRAILPQPIVEGPIQAHWCFVPSAKLGGDAFGYQYLNDDTFTGFLLDVSGHGIGSGMHAANVANTLRRRALPGVDFAAPASVAAGVNDVFPMEEHNGLMFSLWYFAYHLPTRQLRFCAAGHHPSFLVTPQTPVPENLWQKSPVIGMLPFGKWVEGTAQIPPGASLVVFSDGAFEIFTPDGSQWNMEDLRRIITQPAGPLADEPQRIFKAVRAAARPGPLDDDFSVMIITFA